MIKSEISDIIQMQSEISDIHGRQTGENTERSRAEKAHTFYHVKTPDTPNKATDTKNAIY